VNNKNNKILNIDCGSYCSMPEALDNIKKNSNYSFKNINIVNYNKLKNVIFNFNPDIIFHLAAESHVDNSIKNPDNFINSNIIGTYNMLNSSLSIFKKNKKFKFIHVSTDEVYGSLKAKNEKSFTEYSKFYPNSPYSASKASSDLLVRAWNKTYNLPTITTNCVNNFGEWQFPEKLIPVVISCYLKNKRIPVYGNGKNIREWIYVKDHIKQLILISQKGKIGETYNIGSGYEIDNINLIKKICNYFDKIKHKKNTYNKLISYVNDRPGHDFRYSLNSTKTKKTLNLKTKNNFDNNLETTMNWYLQNYVWLLKKKNKK
tara:strand:- start:1852 stop:2802 length:951 start_codon:yes stop_codon:yes gene_type:complete